MPNMLARGDVRGPDFICIGAQKGGTRWLFDQLDQHPQFWMPPIKELQYFNRGMASMAVPTYRRARKGLKRANRWRQRKQARPLKREDIRWLKSLFWLRQHPVDFDRYARLFNLRGERLSGDISPPYAIIPDDYAAAIRQRFPDARIIYLARDPIERLWSQFSMLVRKDYLPNTTDLSNVRAFVEKDTGVAHSSISKVVGRWRLQPNDDRFAFFFFDDLKADAVGLRGRILKFLDADDNSTRGGVPPEFDRKSDQARIVMPDAVREYLVPLFADEIRATADSFGGAAVDWQKKYGL